MQPDIAQKILIILLIFSWGGIIFWLLYITIKDVSPYKFSKENRIFFIYMGLMFGGVFAIFDFIPADSSDLAKIEQYREQAQQEDNRDLLFTIEQIQAQPQIRVKDRKYIEKLIEKGV